MRLAIESTRAAKTAKADSQKQEGACRPMAGRSRKAADRRTEMETQEWE